MVKAAREAFAVLSINAVLPPVSSAYDDGGILVQRFRKDLISVGVYQHPQAGWTLDTTTERIDQWVAAFMAMQKNGVEVVINEDHLPGAKNHHGFVVDAFRDGDDLIGILEIRGEDGIELARKCKRVSVEIEKDFVDGKGVHYGEALVGVAITGTPVVPAQDDFVDIAAATGRPAVKGPLFRAATHGDKPMNEAQLKRIRELLGAGDDLTAENALDRIDARLKELAKGKVDAETKLATLEARIKALEAKGDKDAALDPDVEGDLVEAAETRLDGLVAAGKIDPATKDKLAACLIGPAADRHVYALSRRASGRPTALAREVLDALAGNAPPPLGEKTKGQRIDASRATPGESAPDAAAQKATIDRMAAAGGAGGASGAAPVPGQGQGD